MLEPNPKGYRIAVMALGGQGGGVLVSWIVDLAEHAGWTAQATSVAGVAQRTGATIYYIELVEPTPARQPVMALMPVPGDVDIVIAAELMEAGRAVERGLVTAQRTLLIASSHRAFAVQEKMVPGNGMADGAQVVEVLRAASRHLILADMQALAEAHRSVISASLFGALAGSGVLPFDRAAFEAVVERSGVGVAASLAALRAGAAIGNMQAADGKVDAALGANPMQTAARPLPDRAASLSLQPLVERIRSDFPRPAWDWLGEGVARVVDWQDVAYGTEYLDLVAPFASVDDGNDGHALTVEAARWIAVAMSYDDVIRVADLKSRSERSARVRNEVAAHADDVFGAEEYFHPRLEEVMGLMPRAWADRLDASPRMRAWLATRFDRGRRVHSQTVRGHVLLRLLAGLRRWRRGNRRHGQEQQHMKAWLTAVRGALADDQALAVELLRCRRVVKGYSDTHSRGNSRFDQLMRAAARLRGREGAAKTVAVLRESALRDAEGRALADEMKRLGLV